MMTSAPSSDVAKPANVTPEKLDTNQQTRALPWFIGRRWFALTYCVSQPYNFHLVKKPSKGGSKKGGGGDSHDGLCDVAGLVAGCTADFIEAIEVNSDIVWSAPGGISRDGSHPEHTGDITVDGVGTFRLHWGTESAAGDWLILNSGGEEHPYYRGQCVLEVKNLNCGSSESLPNIRVLLERAPVFTGLDGDRSREGANPITGLAELVENNFFGLGQTGVIDVSTAAAAAAAIAARTKTVEVPGDPTHTAAMGYLSAYLSDRQSFGSLLAGVMENFDGWARRAGEKLELGFFTHPGAVPAGLATLTLHDLIDDPDFANPGIDDPDVITDAIVTGPDREWNMEDSYQKAGNDAVRDRLQELRPQTYARPFLITSYQQKEQAQELANFYGQAAKETTLKWRRERVVALDGITPLQPGDRFLLNYGPSGLLQVFRITKRSDPASGGAVSLTVMPERGLSPLAYIPVADPAPARPAKLAAVPIVNARMFQLPVTWPGLSALPAFVALAERPSGPSKGFLVNFSDADGTYDYIGETPHWALRGAIDVDSPAADDDGRVYLTLAGFDLALLENQSPAAWADNTLLLFCGDEVMSIGAVVAEGGGLYSMDVNRGVLGSLAAAHAGGVEAWIIPRADLVEVTHAELPREGGTRYFKLQAYTPNDTEDLSTALKLTVSVTATIPGAPVLAAAVVGTGKSVSLAWSGITLAAEYAVWRYTANTPASAVKVAEVSALRFVDVDVAIGTAYWYWVTAIDESEQESPKSNGVSATPATIAAGTLDPAITTAITNAQTDATAANTALANIASDSILSPVEKPAVVLDYTNLTAEQSAIDAQATAFGITTEKTAYDTALSALTTYLGTLSGWNTIPGADVVIVGTTFRAKFADVYAARQTLLNLLAAKANPAAPSNPTAPATGLSSSGTYISGDGTCFARIVVNNPAAMPAGAALINVLCRANGSSGYFVANQITAGGGTSTVDDLTPAVAYEIAFQAFSADGVGSAIVAATSSPFTAPNNTTPPAAPTGVAYISGSSSSFQRAPQFATGVLQFSVRMNWTASISKQVAFYESVSTYTDTDAAADAEVLTSGAHRSDTTEVIYSTLSFSFPAYFRVRSVDRSGNRSAWAGGGTNLNTLYGPPAGNMSNQNADDVIVSGQKTGASSAASIRKVLARYQAAVVITLTGGAPTETANLDLTNRGFSTKPDVGTVVVEGTPYVAASYKYNDAGSTSTNAVLFFYSNPSSANLPAGANIVMVELIEYEP